MNANNFHWTKEIQYKECDAQRTREKSGTSAEAPEKPATDESSRGCSTGGED